VGDSNSIQGQQTLKFKTPAKQPARRNRPGYRDQNERILQLLQAREGQWVSLVDILQLGIAQYNARIHELRDRGLTIGNYTEWVDGVRKSWFSLNPKTERPQ
jgi:Helix-turn-helix domain